MSIQSVLTHFISRRDRQRGAWWSWGCKGPSGSCGWRWSCWRDPSAKPFIIYDYDSRMVCVQWCNSFPTRGCNVWCNALVQQLNSFCLFSPWLLSFRFAPFVSNSTHSGYSKYFKQFFANIQCAWTQDEAAISLHHLSVPFKNNAGVLIVLFLSVVLFSMPKCFVLFVSESRNMSCN
jgi:hypothetical protein